MIKFRWSSFHKRIVSYTTGKVCLVETSHVSGIWSAEYCVKVLTGNRRNPYRYEPIMG